MTVGRRATTGETRLGAYVRRIDAALRDAGADGHVGRADFPAALGWIRADIPIAVVEEAVRATARRLGGPKRPRIRVAFLDRDVRRLDEARRRAAGPAPADGDAMTDRMAGACGCGGMRYMLHGNLEDRCADCGRVTDRRGAWR